jgi:outer membrane lipoprotein SlyB
MQPWLSEGGVEVVVTMDDGERRAFRPRDPGRFYAGQRVTVREGELVPLGNRKDGG